MADELEKPNIWEVVAQNQRQIASLEKNQATITTTLTQVLDGFKELHTEFGALAERVSSLTKPRFAIWIAGGALMLAVLGGFSGLVAWGYGINIGHLTDATSDTHIRLQEHVADGHPPRVIERVNALREALERFIIRSDAVDDRIEKDINDRVNRLEQDLKDGLFQ